VSVTASNTAALNSPTAWDVRQIELEIEATRHELDRTLDALQGRFSIRRRLQKALRPLRVQGREFAERGEQLARTATAAVRRQPLPYVVAVVTIAALFAARAATRRMREPRFHVEVRRLE
jgi:Protein of unknown function (DUF3618)